MRTTKRTMPFVAMSGLETTRHDTLEDRFAFWPWLCKNARNGHCPREVRTLPLAVELGQINGRYSDGGKNFKRQPSGYVRLFLRVAGSASTWPASSIGFRVLCFS
jgi:hypothetical protein